MQLWCSGSVAALADSRPPILIYSLILLILLIYSLILKIFITVCHQCYACTQWFWTVALWQTKLSSSVCQNEGGGGYTPMLKIHLTLNTLFRKKTILVVRGKKGVREELDLLINSEFSLLWLVLNFTNPWVIFVNLINFSNSRLTSLIWTTESTVWRSIVYFYGRSDIQTHESDLRSKSLNNAENVKWPACFLSILKEPFHFSEMLTFNGLRAGELWIVCGVWAHWSSSRLSEAWAAWPPSIQQTWTPFSILILVFSFSWRRKKLSCLICTHLFNRSACSGGKFCHCYLHWSHALQTPLMENWNVPSWTERMIYTGIEPLGRVDCHACLSFAKSLQYKLQQSSPLQLNLTWLLSSALPIIFKVSHSLKSVREANQWISPVPQSKTSPVWFVKPAAGSLFHPPLLLYCIHKSLLKRGSNGRVVNIHKFMS